MSLLAACDGPEVVGGAHGTASDGGGAGGAFGVLLREGAPWMWTPAARLERARSRNGVLTARSPGVFGPFDRPPPPPGDDGSGGAEPPPPPPDHDGAVTLVLRNGVAGYHGADDTTISTFDQVEVPESAGNFGGNEQLVVFDADVRHALLRFDLSQIPRDAHVESARLEIYVASVEYPADPQLLVHRVTSGWDEGTCRSQYECDPDGATWYDRGPGQGPWYIPGGDFAELLTAVPVPDGDETVEIDLTSQVRRWQRGEEPNHGVLLRGIRPWSNQIAMASSEDANVDHRPGLIVRYRASLDPADASGPLAPRVENRTCHLPPSATSDILFEPAWPRLSFDRPLWFGSAGDATNLRYIATYTGSIWVFDAAADARQADLFLRTEVTNATPEEGFLGLAFHPHYAQNGRFYTSRSMSDPRRIRVSEWRRDPDNPRRALPESERVLFEIPKQEEMHNGGDLHFGPDGYLYMSTGDGGDDADPFDNARRPSRLLGKILRIDVDGGQPYGIPRDNPFTDGRTVQGDDAPARPEVWAYGFRNPWRWGFDRETGDLWLGDVGEDTWEEVNEVTRGGYYGWPVREGTMCHDDPNGDCAGEAQGLKMPITTIGHDEAHCIIGGRVYRGHALPDLRGQFVFGDCQTGRIWALDLDRSGPTPRVRERHLLGKSDFGLVSFGEDDQGELYFVTFSYGHSIFKLVPRPPEEDATPPQPLPQRLSQTGCFADTATHTVAPGVLPYDVNMPLWSDGALKKRYVALPPGGVIEYDPDGAFELPVGTVLIKSFFLPEAGRAEPRRLETRLFVRQRTGWEGFTYRWNDAQTDAELLPGALSEDIDTPDGTQTWQYPSRAQCDSCHTDAAGHVLGLRVRQLNRPFDYPGGTMNQLEALARAGYLYLPDAAERLPAWPRLDDDAAPAEDRARAYLDANCSQCHRPGTTQPTDLRGTVPFATAGLCDAPPQHGAWSIADARIIAPGDPDRSVLFWRISHRGEGQMPPLGSRLVDPTGVEVVRRWIAGLHGCP